MKAALARETAGVPEPERRAFLMANLIAGQLGYRFVTQFIAQLSSARFIESIQAISPLVPIAAMLSPYIHAFRQPRREWLREMTRVLAGTPPAFLGNQKRAWFTDTLDDVNGVATTIRKMAAAGVAAGYDITVVTCHSGDREPGIPLKNFQPVGEFELPEYELQRLSFPPVLLIMDYLIRENYSELIISTPGPVGLSALFAAKTLGLRAVGIYHTDFPQYVRILTDDSFLETLTWNYMHWFYSQLDVIYVNSQDYRRCWIERGIPAEKLKILAARPGYTDCSIPSRRDEHSGERGDCATENWSCCSSGASPRRRISIRWWLRRGGLQNGRRGAPALYWRWSLSRRDEAPASGCAFHRLPARGGIGQRLCLRGLLCLSEHDGYFWQRRP